MPPLLTSDVIAFVAIAATVLVAIIGHMGNYRIAQINSRLSTQTRDVDILVTFSNIYYPTGDQDSRRLALHFIKLMDNPKTRDAFRQFVIWDTLERNITGTFKFDQEQSDWHMFGDAMYDMAEDNHEKAKQFWCNLIITTQKRWPQHEAELKKLFGWVRDSYQKVGFGWTDCS